MSWEIHLTGVLFEAIKIKVLESDMFKLFITLAILFSTGVYADESSREVSSFVNGLELQKSCNSEITDIENGCKLYVAGVIDSYTFLADVKNLENRICIPDEVTVGQLQSIVKKYLNEHPDDLHYAASYTVLVAIRESFPCKKDLHPHRF